MNPMLRWFVLTTLALLCSAGCVGSPSPACAPECAECRDLAVQHLQVHRSGRHFLADSRLPRVHACSCCKVEVVFYEVDGKPMLKCPKCAPQGVACADCEIDGGAKDPAQGAK